MSQDVAMLLRDAIHIKPQVHDDDFVLQISRISQAHAQMVRDYVVTEEIAAQFDEGLGLVAAAMTGPNRSKGAFVHGSFGSGKSHYMAVMHLLLTGDTQARSLTGLGGVVAKHADVLDKRFLAVDYHLIGATSFDDALFTGYLRTVAAKHPDAPLPVLQHADQILADADNLRAQMGDKAFFAPLAAPGSTTDPGADLSGWGTFATSGAMTAADYDRARRQPPGDPERDHLVSQLTQHYFAASKGAGTWLDMTAGLQAMTHHAQALGYDGVALFLDELVLWLANHVRNSEFIATETAKVTKLVETGASNLAVPLVSFVARQRNLKDFLGDAGVGAEKVAVDDNFKHWESRFTPITLPSTSLPRIVHRRLLQPTGEAGEAALAEAFTRVRANPATTTHLLSGEMHADGVAFEQVYPFAPALIDVMVALSNVMQRSRTALKIMSELLARGYDDLTVEDVIQAGDIFDLVVLEDDKGPLDVELRPLFTTARNFYTLKMRPYLLDKHGLDAAAAASAPRDSAFRREDRLAKTLLISALVPQAASMRHLTASKLAALNFGSVSAMIPGFEAQTVVNLVREWAAEWGEITIAQDVADPIITMTLSGVDTDALLEQVAGHETTGDRERLVRDLLAEALGAQKDTSMSGVDYTLDHTWRGQRRTVDVIFRNPRDENLATETLRATDGRWRLVVAFPFAPGDQDRAVDNRVKIQQLQADGVESDTIVWLPQFLTDARVRDLSRLVQLRYLLSGSVFDKHAVSLPLADREPARRDLTNQRDNLTAQMIDALKRAYGVETPTEAHVAGIDAGWETFHTLDPRFTPANPSAATLRGAVDGVLAAALDARYPGHPQIENPGAEVRRAEAAAVLTLVREAMATGGRIETVERAVLKTVRRVVVGYGVGHLNESTYHVSQATFRWHDDFRTAAASGNPTVADLRRALEKYGLTELMQDLLILAWAALTDRQLMHGPTALGEVTLGGPARLTRDVELREPALPDATTWEAALGRAQQVLGVARGEHALLSKVVARVARQVKQRATELAPAARGLADALDQHADILGLDPGTGRMATARTGADLVEMLAHEPDDLARLQALAAVDLPADTAALTASLKAAGTLSARLRQVSWDLVTQLPGLGAEGAAPLQRLREAAGADELVVSLAPALTEATTAATSILTASRPTPADRAPSGDTATARAEAREREAAARRERDDARRRAEAAERQARTEAAERRRAEERLRELEERAAGERSAQATTVAQIQDIAHQMITEAADLAGDKTLHITWRWQ
ncbi:DUF6079 family protein [Isoptericola croceus]|uniref:DUF6079 family protein n=1 Tax=Isoptericola croceus TaxID=3031406 RepID=UPI0023FA22EA|nr:DUF6079 family protein [Isoptericola croceus]